MGVIECHARETHTPCPTDYVGRANWADEMAKTHDQKQCPHCGLWVIWIPKKPSRAFDSDAKSNRSNDDGE